jgi:hypothetical protein
VSSRLGRLSVLLMLTAALAQASHSECAAQELFNRFEGPELVVDINPGPADSYLRPVSVGDGFVLFWHNTLLQATGQLWRTDGTGDGTFPLPVVFEEPFVKSFDGGFYYLQEPREYSGCANRDLDLWHTDGTTEGTIRIGSNECADPQDLAGILDRPFIWRLDGGRLFVLQHRTRGGLWSLRPEVGGLVQLLSGPFDFQGVLRVGTRILASTFSATSVRQIWLTDGSPEGTVLVTSGHAGYELLAADDEKAYFVLNDTGTRSEGDLWVSDGTIAGTRPTGARVPDGVRGLGFAGDRVILESTTELLITDGTQDPRPFMERPSFPFDPFLSFRDHLIVLRPGETSQERLLWATDGTVEGTGDLTPPFLAAFPSFAFNEEVLLLGHESFKGLLAADGSPQSTRYLAKCSTSCWPRPYAQSDGRFTVSHLSTADYGEEPMLANREATRLEVLVDLCPGPCSSFGGASLLQSPHLFDVEARPNGDPSEPLVDLLYDAWSEELTAYPPPQPDTPTQPDISSFGRLPVEGGFVFAASTPETGRELFFLKVNTRLSQRCPKSEGVCVRRGSPRPVRGGRSPGDREP